MKAELRSDTELPQNGMKSRRLFSHTQARSGCSATGHVEMPWGIATDIAMAHPRRERTWPKTPADAASSSGCPPCKAHCPVPPLGNHHHEGVHPTPRLHRGKFRTPWNSCPRLDEAFQNSLIQGIQVRRPPAAVSETENLHTSTSFSPRL